MASDAAEKSKQPSHQRSTKKSTTTYLFALAWIFSFYFLWEFLDLKRVLLHLETGWWLIFAIGSLVGFVGCFFYLAVVAPLLGWKIELARWEESAPQTIRLASLMMVGAFASWNVVLWPHFHLLTPLLLVTATMAAISIFTFLPFWRNKLFLFYICNVLFLTCDALSRLSDTTYLNVQISLYILNGSSSYWLPLLFKYSGQSSGIACTRGRCP